MLGSISRTIVGGVITAALAGCGGSGDGAEQAGLKATTVLLPEQAASQAAAPRVEPTSAGPAGKAQGWGRQLIGLREAMREGSPRAIVPLAVEVSTRIGSSHFADPVAVRHDDPRLRLLGGRGRVGTNYPYTLAWTGTAATNGDPGVTDARGLPRWQAGMNNGVEFTLPAGARAFELVTINAGAPLRLALEVDSAATNSEGYDPGAAPAGAIRHTRFVVPEASVARRIRLWTGSRPLIGLRLPFGAILGDRPTVARPLSVVFQGDSITAGAVSTHPVFAWPMQAAYRVGITNPIMVAVGGSGYLQRLPRDTGFTLRERIADVTRAVDGGAPDAVVIAAGINDCSIAPPMPFTAAQVGDEARTYLEALRAAAPQMTIVVLGPFTAWTQPEYSVTSRACRDAIFAAARDIPGVFTIDVEDWVTPANRDQVFGNPPKDGPHPTDTGHAIYAQAFARAWARIVGGSYKD